MERFDLFKNTILIDGDRFIVVIKEHSPEHSPKLSRDTRKKKFDDVYKQWKLRQPYAFAKSRLGLRCLFTRMEVNGVLASCVYAISRLSDTSKHHYTCGAALKY